MTNPQHQDVATIRDALNGVIERARTDPAFLAQLKSDTIGTLQAAGIPHDAAGGLSEQMGFESAEVAGYRQAECKYTCDPISCLVTWCACMPWST